MIKGMATILCGIISLQMVFPFSIFIKQKNVDIYSWLGKPYEKIAKEYKIKDAKILSTEGTIIDISLEKNDFHIQTIEVGDATKKIYDIYPENWIVDNCYYKEEEGKQILVLLEKDVYFGVAQKYILFSSKDLNTISKIQYGYTYYPINKIPLPPSNESAKKMLKGKWRSMQGRQLEFTNNYLKDSMLEKVYERVEYLIISPNEMDFLLFKKNKTASAVSIHYSIGKDILYLYKTDKVGIPIISTVEIFHRIS